MREIIVLGIGNRLMMDDGIGVYVVEELKKRNTNPGIRYVIGETDVYFCLDQMDEASYIIIVDAARLDNKPGTVSIIPFKQVLKDYIHPISIHESHLLNEIKMRDKSFDGVFIGIEPMEISYCPYLSLNLQAQFYKIVEKIENMVMAIN